MAPTEGSGSGSGVNRLHSVGLLVPLLAFPFVPWFMATRGLYIEGAHQVVNALIFGVAAFAVTYLLMTMIPPLQEAYALNRAVLLGLLVAEFTIFSSHNVFPGITLILFYVFCYLYASGEIDADAHWINSEKGSAFQEVSHH